MAERFSFSVMASELSLDRISADMEALGDREGWSPELLFKTNLVLEEITLNTSTHGSPSGDCEIEVMLDSRPDPVIIEIAYAGTPFDPLQDAPLPDTDAELSDRAVGGLGLHLVRTMMDELTYKWEEGKNRLAMVAHRRSE